MYWSNVARIQFLVIPFSPIKAFDAHLVKNKGGGKALTMIMPPWKQGPIARPRPGGGLVEGPLASSWNNLHNAKCKFRGIKIWILHLTIEIGALAIATVTILTMLFRKFLKICQWHPGFGQKVENMIVVILPPSQIRQLVAMVRGSCYKCGDRGHQVKDCTAAGQFLRWIKFQIHFFDFWIQLSCFCFKVTNRKMSV